MDQNERNKKFEEFKKNFKETADRTSTNQKKPKVTVSVVTPDGKSYIKEGVGLIGVLLTTDDDDGLEGATIVSGNFSPMSIMLLMTQLGKAVQKIIQQHGGEDGG